MIDENLVVMDGPGPFNFGRLEGPFELLPAATVDAVAIQGQMEVNETGRRVLVRIPFSIGGRRRDAPAAAPKAIPTNKEFSFSGRYNHKTKAALSAFG